MGGWVEKQELSAAETPASIKLGSLPARLDRQPAAALAATLVPPEVACTARIASNYRLQKGT
jgi:hypothetical protein